MFDPPPRPTGPSSDALGELVQGWSPVVARDHRPLGVRLLVRRVPVGRPEPAPTLAGVLDAVLAGFAEDGGVSFPHGLVVLAPQNWALDASMLGWRAPRNVVLEVASATLQDESSLRHLFEVQRQGVRLALRLEPGASLPDAARLAVFHYAIVEAAALTGRPIKAGEALLLALDGDSHDEAQAAIAAGAHGIVGWALVAPDGVSGRALAPAQLGVLELIRRVQCDAEVEEIELAFKADPVLGYMLLTLANSPAFVRTTPISSLRHAITLLGYRRLVKWLVLLLVVASKEPRARPQIYCAVARGFLMENLAAAGGAPSAVQDECFVVGAFSLLSAITGQSLAALLDQVQLPEGVARALLYGEGALGRYLQLATALESVRDVDGLAVHTAAEPLQLPMHAVNTALLRALSATDALQASV